MAILKALKDSKDFSASVDYCEGVTAKEGEKDKCVLKGGYNCDIDRIRQETEETRELFNKKAGRQAKHYVLSFSEEELGQTTDDYQKCLEMGYLFAEKAFPKQEVGIFVHGNTDHVHCHILVHSVSIEDGRKLQLKKDALDDLKQSAGEICQEYGIGLRTQKSAEYEHKSVVSAHAKEKSWTERIKQEVNSVLNQAVSYADFEERLKKAGISCEKKQFTDKKTGQTQDYILFSYFDEEKGKERKIKNTTLASRFRNERLQTRFEQNHTYQTGKRVEVSPEPVKRARKPVPAPIQVHTPDKKQEALNEQKQAIFNETRAKMREADSQEEVERIKKDEEIKQEWVDREKEIKQKEDLAYKNRMALLKKGWER